MFGIKKKYLYAAGAFAVTTWVIQLALDNALGDAAQNATVKALLTPANSPV